MTSSVDPREPSAVQQTDQFVSLTRSQLTNLLAFSPDALIVINAHGEIIHINDQVTSLFGYDPEAMLGQPIEMLLPETLHALHRQHRETYVAAPHARAMGQELELRGRRHDGSSFPTDVSLRPIQYKSALHIVAAIRDVTHQHRLEYTLKHQAEQLQHYLRLIELAHDAIIVRDPISRVIFWNQGAADVYGYPSQDAVGRFIHTLLRTRFPIPLKHIDAQLASEGHWEGELIHQAADGREIYVASRQVLIHDAKSDPPTTILEINRDVTEQRHLEQARANALDTTIAQREFLQDLLDHFPGSVAVIQGHDARLLLANRAATGLWGTEWPVNQPLAAFLQEHSITLLNEHNTPIPLVDLAAMRALYGETVRHRQEILQVASGKRLPILVDALPLVANPGNLGLAAQPEPMALVIHQDVEILKEAEYLKDEFIGIAAHELRTPLTVLKGAVSTLLIQTAKGHGPPLAPWQQETLEDIEPAVDRLTQLTEELLDITRLQAGSLTIQPVMADVIGIIQRVRERLHYDTPHREIKMEARTPVGDWYVDPGRLEQVMTNLISNALKYSPEGGPVTVAVAIDQATEQLSIEVADQGMGIPPHQQAQIFGRFVRADNVRAASIPGTGLGLYLCRMLVELHRGRIWFTSTEGVGTTFFVQIPASTTK